MGSALSRRYAPHEDHDRLMAMMCIATGWAGNDLPVTSPLDVLLREYVTPGMRAAQWKKTRGNYVWRAGNGDRAIVSFQRSVATRSDVSLFYIEVGILPLPAAQMWEYWLPLPKTPQAWYGTYRGRVMPGRAGYRDTGDQWQLPEDDVPSMGPVIKALVVDDVAPMLIQSLNRSVQLPGRQVSRPLRLPASRDREASSGVCPVPLTRGTVIRRGEQGPPGQERLRFWCPACQRWTRRRLRGSRIALER